MIAVTFALPEESRTFRQALRHVGRAGVPPWEYLLGNAGAEEVVLLHTGVGHTAATARTEELLTVVQPRCVLAAGFAGALDPQLRVADLVVATNVTVPDLLARARALAAGDPAVFFGPIIGAPWPIEEASEKVALGRVTGGLAVDMETASIAGVCARAGVPFLAVRAISDAAGDALPVPFRVWFDFQRQRPRPLALLRYLARERRQIIPFMRFVHGLRPAGAALSDFLLRFIAASSSSS